MERFSCKCDRADASISIIGQAHAVSSRPGNLNAQDASGSFAVKNPHLERLMIAKAKNEEVVGNSIIDAAARPALDY